MSLSDKDANQLFNQISKAMKEGDGSKLESLINVETPVEPEVPEEEPTPSPTETPEPEVPETPEEDNPDDPQVEETPADPTPEPVEPPKPEDNSELAQLRAQVEELTKANHSLKSQAGRVPHVQRRLRELDKKLEELEKKQPSPSSQTSEAVLAKLKGIQETDPELAKAIAEAVAAATAGITDEVHKQEKETLSTLRQTEYAQYQEEEAHRLLEMYPNAPEVFANPAWSNWKKSQSQRVQELASSDNADDVAFAFEKYAKDMLAAHPELAPKTEPEKPAVPAAPVVNAEAEKIEAERQRKKSTAAVVNTPNASAKVTSPDDPVALFEKLSQQIRKERTG